MMRWQLSLVRGDPRMFVDCVQSLCMMSSPWLHHDSTTVITKHWDTDNNIPGSLEGRGAFKTINCHWDVGLWQFRLTLTCDHCSAAPTWHQCHPLTNISISDIDSSSGIFLCMRHSTSKTRYQDWSVSSILVKIVQKYKISTSFACSTLKAFVFLNRL